MFLDMLITVSASAVIGWNFGSWVVPATWLATLSLAAIIMKIRRPVVITRSRQGHLPHSD
jgi:uncharacterized membrane protein AbrB (regulator of aidB expression)